MVWQWLVAMTLWRVINSISVVKMREGTAARSRIKGLQMILFSEENEFFGNGMKLGVLSGDDN